MYHDLQSKMVFKIFKMMIAGVYNYIISYIPSGFLSKVILQTTQPKNLLYGRFKNHLIESLFFKLEVASKKFYKKSSVFDKINYCDTLICFLKGKKSVGQTI